MNEMSCFSGNNFIKSFVIKVLRQISFKNLVYLTIRIYLNIILSSFSIKFVLNKFFSKFIQNISDFFKFLSTFRTMRNT